MGLSRLIDIVEFVFEGEVVSVSGNLGHFQMAI
jgi:hypothetical protein